MSAVLRVFLDTNVLIDLFDAERPQHEASTEVRPHGSLKGAIPLERYLNPGLTPAPPDLKAARAQRIEENRQTNCRLERKGPKCRS